MEKGTQAEATSAIAAIAAQAEACGYED